MLRSVNTAFMFSLVWVKTINALAKIWLRFIERKKCCHWLRNIHFILKQSKNICNHTRTKSWLRFIEQETKIKHSLITCKFTDQNKIKII